MKKKKKKRNLTRVLFLVVLVLFIVVLYFFSIIFKKISSNTKFDKTLFNNTSYNALNSKTKYYLSDGKLMLLYKYLFYPWKILINLLLHIQ